MNSPSDISYVKKTNALFLGFILLFMAMELFIGIISLMNVNISILPTLFISQGIILVPSLVFIVFERIELSEWVPFKKVKWSTFWLTILITICISPFISFINVLSQLFTTNIVAELSGEFLSVSPLALMFIVGFFGPFCEEFTFRGIIYHGLLKSGRTLAAILVSALFFGLMHMNLNQFSYAFILGLVFGLINEATGSILPSLTMHILINSFNVGLQYIVDYGMSVAAEAPEGLTDVLGELDAGTDDILMIAGVLLVPALIGLVLSIVVFIAICKNEGSLERIRSLFKPGKSCGIDEEEILQSASLTEAEQTEVCSEAHDSCGIGAEEILLSAKLTEAEQTEVCSEAHDSCGIGAEEFLLSASLTEAGTAPEKKKCPVITVTGWIAVGICGLVIVASDFLSRLFDML